MERPPLQDPNSRGVVSGHPFVDGSACIREKGGLTAGWDHFNKRIGGIKVVGSEKLSLFFHEHGGEAAEKRI